MTSMTKKLAIVFALAVASGSVMTSQASALPPFAITRLHNNTTATITYNYRWGNTGRWQTVVLYPGNVQWHSVRNVNPPYLYVRFDNIGGDGRTTITSLRLRSYGAFRTDQGKTYRFNNSGNYISLGYIN